MLMIQSNSQLPMKTSKVKGPPPVPPRPNQSVVAEALAKTRKAVAESRAHLTKSQSAVKGSPPRAKTLERSYSTDKPVASPRQNGLARVKSFIRDVISDRGSSSDERRSSGANSRRSSSDSSSIPAPASVKKSNESLNSKVGKTCRQILVRSLSTSNKLDQDGKCKVSKSSSFADKTVPVRKAPPPPPLSPKPKLKQLKALALRRNTLERNKVVQNESPELSPYSSPIDAKPPYDLCVEESYATVEEVCNVNDRLSGSPTVAEKKTTTHVENIVANETNGDDQNNNNNSNSNSLERKTSRVTEMLISEIIASRNNNKQESNTVIDKGKSLERGAQTNGECNIEPIPKDMNNHEILIYELQTMRSQGSVPEALAAAADDVAQAPDCEPGYANYAEANGNPEEHNDQAYAYILDDDLKSRLRKQYRAISTMSLHGLPPLPKSLSGFADAAEAAGPPSPDAAPPPPGDLDGQLAYLKKEMASLRQLDLSLLSELWTLSEVMASWRRQIERGPRLRPAPPPPPPPPPHYLRT